eukprot:8865045-Lingulodinium_polyedra.AAC.1
MGFCCVLPCFTEVGHGQTWSTITTRSQPLSTVAGVCKYVYDSSTGDMRYDERMAKSRPACDGYG